MSGRVNVRDQMVATSSYFLILDTKMVEEERERK